MKLVTNPGANLSEAELQRGGVTLLSQIIVVDGIEQDTRQGSVDQQQVDRWVKSARVHPYVLGTSAAEFVEVFRQLGSEDSEILAITGSRHIIDSYASAVAAARTIRTLPGYGRLHVHVLDSRVTDAGVGLVTMYAAEALRHGLPAPRVVALTRAFAQRAKVAFTLHELDYLVKGGRASFLKSMMASLLDISPVLGMVEGEVKPLGRCKRTERVQATLDQVVDGLGEGRRVWVGIGHGEHEAAARELEKGVRRVFQVERCVVRPFSPQVYLNLGPGSLGLFVNPVDELEWAPPPEDTPVAPP